jgi:hypothetical protein
MIYIYIYIYIDDNFQKKRKDIYILDVSILHICITIYIEKDEVLQGMKA